MNRIIATALSVLIVLAACGPATSSSSPPPAPVAVAPTNAPPTTAVRATRAPATARPAPTVKPVATPAPTVAPTERPRPTPQATASPTASPEPTKAPATARPTATPTPSATPSPTATERPRGDGNQVLLGRWTTRFTPGPLNGGGANIRVPAKRIDGTIVRPGQMFQFIDAIVPVTDPPFAMGGILRNGRIVPAGAMGGGMCSASTTLFNAAMRAGLRIVERHAHALYINRYPVGLDATVFSTGRSDGQDVKFINDTDQKVLIRAYSGKRRVTFEIWGIDDGRRVKLGRPVVENRRPGVDYIEFTDDLAPGQRRRVDDVYDGYESSVSRIVRDRSGNVISRDTWHSRYRSANGLVKVGRRPGDPAAGTRIRADEYRRNNR